MADDLIRELMTPPPAYTYEEGVLRVWTAVYNQHFRGFREIVGMREGAMVFCCTFECVEMPTIERLFSAPPDSPSMRIEGCVFQKQRDA